MNSAKVSHELRLSSWADRIRCQQESGLPIKEWCSQNAISRDQFYYWKRRLKESCLASALPDIVPLNLPVPGQGCTTCTTLSTPVPDPEPVDNASFTSCTTSPIALSLGGINIEISATASDDLVCRVIKAVRHA